MAWVEKTAHGLYIRTLPVRISHQSRQSPIKLNQGYLNVAGLLCSKKKWPIQANAYPWTNPTAMSHHHCVATAVMSSAKAILVPVKCSRRQVRVACSPT